MKVPKDASFVQVPESNHVLDAVYGGGVHRLDASVRRQPLLLAVVVADGDPSPLGGDDAGADGHVEFIAGRRFDPDVVTLKEHNIYEVSNFTSVDIFGRGTNGTAY